MSIADSVTLSTTPALFATLEQSELTRIERSRPMTATGVRADIESAEFFPTVDERMRDVYSRARNPTDPLELRNLYVGRVESELGARALRPELAARWLSSRPHRTVCDDDVLRSRATAGFVKELFNFFFRDDLYGSLRSNANVVVSSGSVDEQAYGLPVVLKECIRYALNRDWYGYSDSRGRVPARDAIAAYESARSGGLRYEASNVAITMGGTFAISALADFVALRRQPASAAVCAVPNYPPLVEAVARRMDVRLVPLPCRDGTTSLAPLIASVESRTPLVLLQTVTNPTGAAVDEAELERLIRTASPSTTIILDECHECLGPSVRQTPARAAANVVRVSSMSKTWSAPGLKLGWILADRGFIDEYYEYASTTFGGPPSFFYTLIEVMARMERWLIEGVDDVRGEHVSEFEPSYGLTEDRLARAYASYRSERLRRESALIALRDAAVAQIASPRVTVVRPRYSINMAIEFGRCNDSYSCFRQALTEVGVAVFPGILTFCLGGAAVRITTARARPVLDDALNALRQYGEH